MSVSTSEIVLTSNEKKLHHLLIALKATEEDRIPGVHLTSSLLHLGFCLLSLNCFLPVVAQKAPFTRLRFLHLRKGEALCLPSTPLSSYCAAQCQAGNSKGEMIGCG